MDNHNDIEFLICDISALWRKLYNQKAKLLNLTAIERRVLLTILREPGLTQCQLATAIEQEPQGLTRVLDKLEKSKWVLRQPHPTDRRAKILRTTQAGETLCNQLIDMLHPVRPKALDKITAKETKQLKQHLMQIKQNLTDIQIS